MRLPLQPMGLHSDEDAPAAETPQDAAGETSTPPTSVAPEAPAEEQPETQAESEDEQGTSWWGTLWSKFEGLKEWAGGVFDAVKSGISN